MKRYAGKSGNSKIKENGFSIYQIRINKNGLFIYQLCLYNKSVFQNVQKSLMVRLEKFGLMVKNVSFNVNLINNNNVGRGMNVKLSTELQINRLFRLTHL